MERLTTRCAGHAVMAWEHEEQHTTQEWIDMLTDRLAEYEDTGLTPEQIRNAQETLRCFDNIGIKRGNEIVTAEEEGRLVVLPCSDDTELLRDGKTYRANHWNCILTAFCDDPTTKSGRRLGLFTVKEAEEALKGDSNDDNS